MADVVSPEVRSRMMSGIRSKNTKPEMLLRRGLHRAGLPISACTTALCPGGPTWYLLDGERSCLLTAASGTAITAISSNGQPRGRNSGRPR